MTKKRSLRNWKNMDIAKWERVVVNVDLYACCVIKSHLHPQPTAYSSTYIGEKT